jgi:hypothetical protein
MGTKISTPSTPDIRQLPANTGTNTIANNQSMIQRGFPPLQNVPTMEQFGQTARLAPGVSLEEAYNNFLSGPLGGGGPTPKPLSPGYNPLGSPRPTSSLQPNLNTESAQYLINPVRPGSSTENSLLSAGLGRTPISGKKIIPTMEQYGAMVKLAPGVSLQEAYNNAFGPLAIQSPDSTAGIMSGLPQVPTPPGFPPGGAGPRIPIQSGNLGGAMIPEQGPLGPGLVGGTAPSTGIQQPFNQPPLRPRPGGGVVPRPPSPVPRPPAPGSNAINQAQKQFGQYGFDEDVMNFLAGNIQRGYIDLGMNIGYNPETEMFSVSGGRRPGPTTNYTLDQFTNQFIGSSAPSTGIQQPFNQPPMELINPIRPGMQPINQPPMQTPTEVPQPTNPVTGNTSPIGGSQQDFDAYMNSYVNDLINQRMKNVFGGIMNALN